MTVKELLKMYSPYCRVAVIEDGSIMTETEIKILWSGYYDYFKESNGSFEYKDLRKYLNCKVIKIDSFLNDKTNSLLQIYIQLN